MNHDIKHAIEKITECATILERIGQPRGQQEAYRHNIFQMSYNMGRLSELKGLGRTVYDTCKPLIEREHCTSIPGALRDLMRE